MIEIFGNNAATTLAANIGPSALSFTVLGGTGNSFPSPAAGQYFRATFNDALTGLVREIVWVTGRSGDTFTCIRGQEGFAPQSWVSGDAVDNLPTAGAMANLLQIQQLQQNTYNFAVDSGSANAYVITHPQLNLATPVPGAPVFWQASNNNTGASTIKVDGGSTYPLLGASKAALQGGEVRGFSCMVFDSATSSYILIFSMGGNVISPTATGTNQVPNYAQTQATYAQKAGATTQPFSSSNVFTPTITSSTGALNLYSANGVISYTLDGTAYQPVYGATNTANGLSYVNYTFAQATYANISGNAGHTFATSRLFSNYLDAGANIMYLASNNYTASVNSAISGYVPHMVANASNAQQAVNLGQADGRYAAINGNGLAFTVSNMYLNGNSIVSNTGGALYLQANGGVNVVNNGASNVAPLQAAPGTAGNQVVNFSQFPFAFSYNGYARFPGGLIIQWGTTNVSNGVVGQIFPIAFPSACLKVVCCEGAANGPVWLNNPPQPTLYGAGAADVNGVQLFGLGFSNGVWHTAPGGITCNWIAFGG